MSKLVAKADFRRRRACLVSLVGKPLSIFISYPTENHKIAQAIEGALRQFDRSKFDVFLDRSRINEGSGLRDTIVAALQRADYFIGIGPEANRGNFSWCGFELGYFLAANKDRNKNVLAIYNNDIPDQFHEFKNVQVVSLESQHRSELGSEIYAANQCDLYHFFSGLSRGNRQAIPARRTCAIFYGRAGVGGEKCEGRH